MQNDAGIHLGCKYSADTPPYATESQEACQIASHQRASLETVAHPEQAKTELAAVTLLRDPASQRTAQKTVLLDGILQAKQSRL